jgi:carbamoyltransferase
MYILGISAFYHDSAACLYRNCTLLGAVEEERFSGIKGDSSFPLQSIKWLLKSNGIKIEDVSVVCWYENPELKRERVLQTFKRIPLKNIKRIFYYLFNRKHNWDIKKILRKEIGFKNKVHFVSHHLSHACLSYFTSSFNECTIVTVDGVGEKETITISKAFQNVIKKLKSIEYPHSLGLFYSAFTAFLGFKPNEGEYKVMGLAAYGDSSFYYDKIKNIVSFDKGVLKIKMDLFSWDYSDDSMFNWKLIEYLSLDPRDPSETSIKAQYKHVAAAVQKVYEETLFQVINHSYELNTSDNLCLGGGCAYNGLANAKISDNTPYKNVWIPLSPSDSGSSIGACLHYLNVIKFKKRKGQIDPYQGPSFNDSEIGKILEKYRLLISFDHMETKDLLESTAKLLNYGRVIGWFQGRMEFGARALGNRSILASPLIEDMQNRINSVIKKRESFRPFAPSVPLDDAPKYFEIKDPIPYMNMVVRVKPECSLPAVTHVDGTARVQTVTQFDNPRFYRLLKRFGEFSGVPVLLNTSFNFKDQAITLTPEEALIRFLDSDMDHLIIENFFISKKW